MGVSELRSRLLMSCAVSKPFIPGICTSSRMTAKSCSSTWRSASSPELARTSSGAQRLQDGLQRHQVLGPVVHHQDAGPGLRCRGAAVLSLMRTPSRQRGTRRPRMAARCGAISSSGSTHASGTALAAERGITRTSAVSGSCTTAWPPASAIAAQPARTVGVGAGEHHADDVHAVHVGGGLEHHVDGGAAVAHRARRCSGKRTRRLRRAGGSRAGPPTPRGPICCLSFTSATGRPEHSCSSSHSSSDSLARCCTTTTGSSKSSGSPATMVRSACRPPAEAPTTTTR